jgi:hypothetical protein
LPDCPHTNKDEAIDLLAEYEKKTDAAREKANLKNLGSNGAIAESRGGQTANITAERTLEPRS